MHYFDDRQTIWKARFKLQKSKIFLNEDFPKEIVERRKTLLPFMKAANKEVKKSAFLNYDKLHLVSHDKVTKKEIHNIVTVNSLHKLPPNLDPKFISTRSNDDSFAFFGKHCPLSNFHAVPVMYRHMHFHCSEQVYQFRKAELTGDDRACLNIRSAETALEAKHLGDRIKASEDWMTKRQKIMKDTIRLKLAQNSHIKQYLLGIKQETIVEASPHDTYWGAGHGLDKDEVLNSDLHRGSNYLGKLLMELRTEFLP
jgi:ribA/ribD-fused uncharacterized protein